MNSLLLATQLILAANVLGIQQPVATTHRGKILGSLLTSRKGKTIYAFRGIRYAKAPVNELRFKPPQPLEEWKGSYNATQDAPTCPQIGFPPNSEDCLFLNVYTTALPNGRKNPKRPVIVHIHPNAFVGSTGRSNWAGPQYLLDEDILLVTFNYRLGVLGFISTGTKDAPGNLGMKDQVEALKWVKKNIIYFGGDPNLITIYGYSAGATSVNLHMMSPMSKGLFQRAIASSNSALGTWPQKTNLLDLTTKTARIVGCPNTSIIKIVDCLKTVPAEDLGQSIRGLREFGDGPILTWQPVIEPDFGQSRFLTDNPVQLVLNGKFENVPLMMGLTKDEFGYLAFFVERNETLLRWLNEDFDKYAPISLSYERNTRRSHIISNAIRKFYFGNRRIDNSTFKGLADMYSDGLTGFGVNRAVKLFSEKSSKPVYYYQFSYQGRYSNFYIPGTNNVPYGVIHMDDLNYLFYISELFPEFKTTDPESRTVDRMIKIWADFARTGNPTPVKTPLLDDISWEPFTVQNLKYINIGNKLEMKANLHEKRYEVWESVVP